MKSVKLFFKILLLVTASTTAVCAQAQNTSAPFIRAFEQLEALKAQKSTSAQSLSMDLYRLALLAQDLPAQQYNDVVFKLLATYVSKPQLRSEIQGVLSAMGDNLSLEIFNSRQRFETPIVIARALTWGFTIVVGARSLKTFADIWTGKIKSNRTILPPSSAANPMAAMESKSAKDVSLSKRMWAMFQSAATQCKQTTACSNWMAGVMTGAVVEGISYAFDKMDTDKVHPLEALRLVQAHLGCELHWSIYEFGQNWEKETNWLALAEKIDIYNAEIIVLRKSYSALENSYRKDFASFKKYYPKSEDWWKLASTVFTDKGQTCEQISTDAMALDIEKISTLFTIKFGDTIRADMAKKIEEKKAEEKKPEDKGPSEEKPKDDNSEEAPNFEQDTL